jgi:transposase
MSTDFQWTPSMTEQHSETVGLKVVSVGRDGKRRFDRQAKRKLVEACLEPGASVAGLALKHGVNANLLHKWIKLHQQRLSGTSSQSAMVTSAFVPVVEIGGQETVVAREPIKTRVHQTEARASSHSTAPSRLTVQMPNGVTLKLECSAHDAPLISAMIETLGRCDVSAGR